MSIALYTPATGFPDLEIKIAYGLARVGIEAGFEPEIIPQKGFYQIDYNNFSSDKLNNAFLIILKRLLSSDRFFDLGVKAKDKTKYSAKEAIVAHIEQLLKQTAIDSFFTLNGWQDFNFKKDKFCGHKNAYKFGGSSGLILLSSFHAGKPYHRDWVYDKFNLNLCEICGYLAVLGLYSFGFIIQLGNKKYTIILPVPEKKLGAKYLQMLFSLQKTLHNFQLLDIQPLKTLSVSLLSKVPSISDIINNSQLKFHSTLVSKDNRGDTVVEETALINAVSLSKYISDSPYNCATIENLIRNSEDKLNISTLIKLTDALEIKQKYLLPEFARLYVRVTSNLLYPETAKYLLKEIAMIKNDFIENQAILSLARTLRYFIKERKYGYADDIRNARKDSRDFEETIAKMLREGELRRVQQEQDKKSGKRIDNWIHMPNEDDVKEVFRLANNDFESTKLALVMLAFSFPSTDDKGEKAEVNNG